MRPVSLTAASDDQCASITRKMIIVLDCVFLRPGTFYFTREKEERARS